MLLMRQYEKNGEFVVLVRKIDSQDFIDQHKNADSLSEADYVSQISTCDPDEKWRVEEFKLALFLTWFLLKKVMPHHLVIKTLIF